MTISRILDTCGSRTRRTRHDHGDRRHGGLFWLAVAAAAAVTVAVRKGEVAT